MMPRPRYCRYQGASTGSRGRLRETMDTYSHVVANLQEEVSEALDARRFEGEKKGAVYN